jgi:hypothetical protein
MKSSSKSKNSMPLPERRFPPLWTVEEQDACFVLRDRSGPPLVI